VVCSEKIKVRILRLIEWRQKGSRQGVRHEPSTQGSDSKIALSLTPVEKHYLAFSLPAMM
jgi:hypothetical protein